MASFGMWTHKDQVSQLLVYEIIGREIVGFCDVTCHIIGFFCNMPHGGIFLYHATMVGFFYKQKLVTHFLPLNLVSVHCIYFPM